MIPSSAPDSKTLLSLVQSIELISLYSSIKAKPILTSCPANTCKDFPLEGFKKTLYIRYILSTKVKQDSSLHNELIIITNR